MRNGTSMIKRRAFTCGYCTQSERLAIRDGKWKKINFPAISFLFKNEKDGYTLFDLGYSERISQLYSAFPYKIQQRTLPVTMPTSHVLKRQLEAEKIDSDHITTIIISHFHSDHLGDLDDYKNATIVCSKKGLEFSRKLKGFSALRGAVHPDLITKNIKENAMFFEEQDVIDTALPFFPKGYRLDSEGELIAISLPGHAVGQYGLYLKSEKIFLVADAAWSISAVCNNCLPHPLTRFINASWKAFRDTLSKLHQLSIERPDIKILPSHDPRSKDLFDA